MNIKNIENKIEIIKQEISRCDKENLHLDIAFLQVVLDEIESALSLLDSTVRSIENKTYELEN